MSLVGVSHGFVSQRDDQVIYTDGHIDGVGFPRSVCWLVVAPLHLETWHDMAIRKYMIWQFTYSVVQVDSGTPKLCWKHKQQRVSMRLDMCAGYITSFKILLKPGVDLSRCCTPGIVSG